MSVFWYPQLARPLPRSGRIPRSAYNKYGTNIEPVSSVNVEEDSFVDMADDVDEGGPIRKHGGYLFGAALIATICFSALCLYLHLNPLWSGIYLSGPLFIFLAASLALTVPAFLAWRHRRMLRVVERMESQRVSRVSVF